MFHLRHGLAKVPHTVLDVNCLRTQAQAQPNALLNNLLPSVQGAHPLLLSKDRRHPGLSGTPRHVPTCLGLSTCSPARHVLVACCNFKAFCIKCQSPLEVEKRPWCRHPIWSISFQLQDLCEVVDELVVFLFFCHQDETVYVHRKELISLLCLKRVRP